EASSGIELISYGVVGWIELEGMAAHPFDLIPGVRTRSEVCKTKVCRHIAGVHSRALQTRSAGFVAPPLCGEHLAQGDPGNGVLRIELDSLAQVLLHIARFLLHGCASLVIFLGSSCCDLQLPSCNCGTANKRQWRK